MPWIPAAAAIAGGISAAVGAAGSITAAAIGQQHQKYKDPTEGFQKWSFMEDPNSQREGQNAWSNAQKQLDASQQARAGLMSVAQQYSDAAQGKGPSVAQEQLKQGLDRSVSEAANTAAGAQGDVGLGLAAAQQQNAQADLARKANADSALLRAEEIDAARRGELGAYGAIGESDLARAGLLAGQGQFMRGLGMQQGLANLGAEQSWDQFKAGGLAQQQQLEAGQAAHNNDLWAKGVGGAFSAVGSGINSAGQLGMQMDYMDYLKKQQQKG